MAILDGYNSCVYIEPTDDLMKTLSAKHAEDVKKLALLQELKGKPSVTLDGRSVHIYANIGGPSDLGSVNDNDAEGVGLFRSEFVYLNSKEEPTEEQQFTWLRSWSSSVPAISALTRPSTTCTSTRKRTLHSASERFVSA